ncbi:hypothetical protein C5610_11835 [Idiomarina sp. OT37-5b]|jgi:copper(I)-binding protein|uniref:Copper(I)-binding protein n=1 Tax=Idiomarina aquatica TaxID=1327752 RepID=A0AA94EDB4_9GAMM|nr:MULTISPECIES: copper chaperone PCu(A)C [Idiomarina]AVJ56911.1 hypothetical protein C5610_11835 [Idiomarina sp. OT37-5b]RUO42353.1 hypothetical protein CWE23_09595 [Idiomarina aquatica]
MKNQLNVLLAGILACCTFSAWAVDVTATNAWARASIPGASSGAGYVSLHNETASVITLVGMKSDVSKTTELHTHIHEDGMMKMTHVSEVSIAPGETLEMKPGGYHIMLMGLQEPLQEGSTVAVELLFADGRSQLLQLEVRKP